MIIPFSKMHSLGNDFIIIDNCSYLFKPEPRLIRKLSDRHRGIGFDQLLLLEKSTDPQIDFNYRIFNADGSEAEQCGNGARCLMKYILKFHHASKNELLIKTKNRLMKIGIDKEQNLYATLGIPQFRASEIPFLADTDAFIHSLSIDKEILEITAVNVGNPHCVLIVEDVVTAAVAVLGAAIETHPQFPQKTNVEFLQIIARNKIKLRVFERGVGETTGCGSGASAAVAAGIVRGLLEEDVTVGLPGGELRVIWKDKKDHIKLVGDAHFVFAGQFESADLI